MGIQELGQAVARELIFGQWLWLKARACVRDGGEDFGVSGGGAGEGGAGEHGRGEELKKGAAVLTHLMRGEAKTTT